uniref:Myosin motor domain-containing protein n=1 Tax=Parastrongyloides trichosuri TaxID=131310 RepID=A0A0N4ZUU0_PARTI
MGDLINSFNTDNQLVFLPDIKDGYLLAEMLPSLENDKILVKIYSTGEEKECSFDTILPADNEENIDFDDHCAMKFLNPGSLLYNSKNRFMKNKIYTYVANILISINPYKIITDLYTTETMDSYSEKSLGVMPPHIFAIAEKAYNEMRRYKISQSIVVSGESGAGKTESQKQILRYICKRWGKSAGNIEKRILETNPILEAFGNAKTTRNNNSSRFGKFVEIHFDQEYSVAGGYVSHYLLEKSRIVLQSNEERNYHIFYQLLAGASDEWREEFRLGGIDKFNYLKNGLKKFFTPKNDYEKIPKDVATSADGFLSDVMINDYTDFKKLIQSLHGIGFDDIKVKTVFQTIAGILHLGNIKFEEDNEGNKGGCSVTINSMDSLAHGARLLGLDEETLKTELTARLMQATRGGIKGTAIMVQLKPNEACNARDALAKKIYGKLFDEIVSSINRCIPFNNDSSNFIGVLDIAGFEFFKRNCFEQFCINYSNEKLQQFFNDRILKQEQDLYEKEGLDIGKIEFSDNLDCILVMEGKGTGIIDLLNEEMRLPKPSYGHFTESVLQKHNGNFRIEIPRKSAIKEHRNIKNDEGFIIRHFAGSVCYETKYFLEKNNDSLHMSLELLLETSDNPILQLLFKNENKSANEQITSKSSKLSSPTVSSKFKTQLDILIQKLDKTGTHFVRCLKPNSDMVPNKFDGQQILNQLSCSGMINVLELMQEGFPSRTVFQEFYDSYKNLLPEKLRSLEPRIFAKCLFNVVGLKDNDYKFGLTKVFFRPGKFAEFDKLMRQDSNEMKEMIAKIQNFLNKSRWNCGIYSVIALNKLNKVILNKRKNIVKIQACVRGFLTRKCYKPILRVYSDGKKLEGSIYKLYDLVEELEGTSKEKWISNIYSFEKSLKCFLDTLVNNDINTSKNIFNLFDEIKSKFDSLITNITNEIFDLQNRKRKDEEEKRIAELERIRHEMEEKEKAEKAKQLEEQRKREEREKQLEEERALIDEENRLRERLRQIEAQHKKLVESPLQNKQINIEKEQRKLDSVMINALTPSEKSEVIDINDVNKPSIISQNTTIDENADIDDIISNLHKLKYESLRNTINTSKDKRIVMACRAEFHRRLHQFQNWKNKNQSRYDKSKDDIVATPTRNINRQNPLDTERRERMLKKIKELREKKTNIL